MGPGLSFAALGICAVLLVPVPGMGRAADTPFDFYTLGVPGRTVEAFAATVGLERPRLVILSVEGSPPDEQRFVSVVPEIPPGGPPAEPWTTAVGPEVVAVDLADLGGAPGPELVGLTAGELWVWGEKAARFSVALSPSLPLPPRTRQLSRLRMLRDWNADGGVTALLPTLAGALLLSPLAEDDTRRPLALPVLSLYETFDDSEPIHEGYARAELVWPSFARADDDGDGRLDLFAFTRFGLSVFRAGADGLELQPARSVRFPPFSADEERRHEINTLRAFASDLDGDGLADLVVHRSDGSLLGSHATTTFYTNPGHGASPERPAAATLRARGGFGSVRMIDLDGDGRQEVVQTIVPFGVLQLIRLLVTRRIEASLRIHRLEAPGVSALSRSWETEIGGRIDFDGVRIEGLLPNLSGDWDGDGVHDLIHGDGSDAVRIRLGRRSENSVDFDGPSTRVPLGFPVDRAVVADLDGDGLDDLALYDPLDPERRFHWGRNRGIWPGAPPALQSTD